MSMIVLRYFLLTLFSFMLILQACRNVTRSVVWCFINNSWVYTWWKRNKKWFTLEKLTTSNWFKFLTTKKHKTFFHPWCNTWRSKCGKDYYCGIDYLGIPIQYFSNVIVGEISQTCSIPRVLLNTETQVPKGFLRS